MGTIINVCGPGNSGTTILHLMLGSGNDAFACGEVGKWYRLARYREDTHLDSPLDQFEDTPEEDFHATVLDTFGVEFVIDSSKGIDWIIDTHAWADKHDLKVFNLLMWKRPVDQAYSRWKRNDFDRWYREYTRYYENFFERSGLEFFSISYDDLVAHPASKLALICQHAGMPYFEGKEKFWEENHAHTGGNEGVRNQLQSGETRIEKKPHKREYAPLAQQVREQTKTDDRLQSILHGSVNLRSPTLRFRTLLQAIHNPTLYQLLWHKARGGLVSPALRLRWNWLGPNVVQPIRQLRQRLSAG